MRRYFRKRLPQLKIHSAAHPREALGFVEEAEIILAWQNPDEVLKPGQAIEMVFINRSGK